MSKILPLVLSLALLLPTLAEAQQPEILTPKPPDTPRINGARVFGARPGRPFLFTVPVTGKEPLNYSAEGLPEGLKIDAKSGRISGRVDREGKYRVRLTARNALGRDRKPLVIEIGDRIALTPPMGWNSWNCFAGAVDQGKVKAAAEAMVRAGLVRHGWTYVNIDDTWQGTRGGPFNGIQVAPIPKATPNRVRPG